MKKKFTLIIFILASINSIAQNFATGKRIENYIDVSRNNRQVSTILYYPADVAGNDVDLAAGNTKFPVVVFGHGFVIDPSSYEWLADSLTQRGYIVALPSTESGILPSHTDFGKDLSFLCNYITGLNDVSSSFLFGRVIKKSAVAGHSMGGGSSFLAASGNTSINAIFNFAAAETNPSAIAAASSVTIPALIFSGSSDCIVPDNTQQSMYENINDLCKSYIDITNALHCQYANNNGTCVLGQVLSGCNSSGITPVIVFNKVTMLLIPFLDFYLKDNCTAGDNFITSYNNIQGVNKMQLCSVLPSCGPLPVSLQDFYGKYNKGTVSLNWSAASLNNFKNFVVEKSTDAISFSSLAVVMPVPFSSTNSYAVNDKHPYANNSFYRLKIINVDESYSYSNIIKIATPYKEISLTKLFPLPAEDVISYELISDKKLQLQLNIYNTTGQRILKKNIFLDKGINNQTLPVDKMSAGFYILQFKNEQENITISTSFIKK